MLCSYPVLSGCHCLQNQVGTMFPPWPTIFPTLRFNNKPMQVVCTPTRNNNSSSSKQGSFLLFFKKTPKYIESLHNSNSCLFEMYTQIAVAPISFLYYCMWLHITFSLSCSSLSVQQGCKVLVLGSYNFVTNHFQTPWLRTVFML